MQFQEAQIPFKTVMNWMSKNDRAFCPVPKRCLAKVG